MKNSYWFGFLDAGTKSSMVARDPDLGTGNTETIYLYHLNQDKIKEYKLEIVEPKLRELNKEEAKKLKTLEKKFKAALSSFTGRASSAASIPDKGKIEEKPKKETETAELGNDLAMADDDGWEDDDS